MNSKKAFYVMLGVVGLLSALLIAAVVYGDIFLKAESAKLLNLKLENQVIEAQQIALGQAKKDLEKYKELKAIAKQIVPQDKEQTKATREIVSLAAQSGIRIASISFPVSSLGQAPVKAPATTDTTTDTKPATPVAPSITQVKPVEGIKGLYQLDIVVTSDVANPTTYPRLIDFLSRLEHNRRTSHVTQITIQPDTINRQNLNFTLTITIYVKP